MTFTPMTTALLLYLAVLAIIGVRSARSIKGIPDFFVARKGAGVRAVSGSLVASILGGSAIIGAIDAGPRIGGAAAWFMLTGAFGLMALIPLANRAYALGKYSLPDLIGNMYGAGPRAIASIVIPIAWTGIIAAQVMAGAKLLQSFVPVSYQTGAVISAAVFILYTMAGGQHSILRTDFLQAALIIAGLALVGGFAFVNGDILAGGIAIDATAIEGAANRTAALSNAAASLGNAATGAPARTVPAFPFNTNFTPLDLLLLILTYGTTFTAGPDMFSRIFCARDAATAKKSIAIASAVLVPVAAAIGYLAAFGAGLGNVQGARVMAIVHQVLPTPFLPLIAIALLSVVLSSADTLLLSSSVIVCEMLSSRGPRTACARQNTVQPIRPATVGAPVEMQQNGKRPGTSPTGEGLDCAPSDGDPGNETQFDRIDDRRELFRARAITFANGIVALAIALHFTDIIGILLLSLAVYAGAFTVPVLWGLLGLRSATSSVNAAIVAGSILALAGKTLPVGEAAHIPEILTVSAFFASAVLLAFGKISEKKRFSK